MDFLYIGCLKNCNFGIENKLLQYFIFMNLVKSIFAQTFRNVLNMATFTHKYTSDNAN